MTKACTDQVDLYEDVRYCRGKKATPGVRPYFFQIPRRDVISIPAPAGNAATTLAASITITDNFVLAADKKWHRIDLVPDKGKFTPESQGETYSKTSKNSASLPLPGTEEEASALASQLMNDDSLFLIPQRNGKFRLFGDDEFTVDVAYSQDSGDAVTGTNTTTLNISVPCETAPPFYAGEIVATDGTFSGATGKLITTPVTPATGGTTGGTTGA